MSEQNIREIRRKYQYLLESVLSQEDEKEDGHATVAASITILNALRGGQNIMMFDPNTSQMSDQNLEPRFPIAEIENDQDVNTFVNVAIAAVDADCKELENVFTTYVKLLQRVGEEAQEQFSRAPNSLSNAVPSVAALLVPARGMPICTLLKDALTYLIGTVSDCQKNVQAQLQNLKGALAHFYRAINMALLTMNNRSKKWSGLSAQIIQQNVHKALEPARDIIGRFQGTLAQSKHKMMLSFRMLHDEYTLCRRMIRMARQGLPPNMPENANILFALTQAMDLTKRFEIQKVEELIFKDLVLTYRLCRSFVVA